MLLGSPHYPFPLSLLFGFSVRPLMCSKDLGLVFLSLKNYQVMALNSTYVLTALSTAQCLRPSPLSAFPLSALTACFTKTLHASLSCSASQSHSHTGELGGAKARPEPESGTLCEDVLVVSTEPQMAWGQHTHTPQGPLRTGTAPAQTQRQRSGPQLPGSQGAGQRPTPRLRPIPATESTERRWQEDERGSREGPGAAGEPGCCTFS